MTGIRTAVGLAIAACLLAPGAARAASGDAYTVHSFKFKAKGWRSGLDATKATLVSRSLVNILALRMPGTPIPKDERLVLAARCPFSGGAHVAIWNTDTRDFSHPNPFPLVPHTIVKAKGDTVLQHAGWATTLIGDNFSDEIDIRFVARAKLAKPPAKLGISEDLCLSTAKTSVLWVDVYNSWNFPFAFYPKGKATVGKPFDVWVEP